MNIVALGNAACKIADVFAKYPMYTIYKIDTDIEDTPFCKKLQKFSTPEQYEEHCPDLKPFFSNIDEEDVLFICVGSSPLTGCALRLLEPLQNKKITVLYVRPDLTLLTDKAILQERVVFNVLQQYARSGRFEKIYLIDNVTIEQILGDIPITQYYERLNEMIGTTFHLVNVYKHIKPIMESQMDIPEVSRIATIGIFDGASGKDQLFYPLHYKTSQIYYYAYNKEVLEKDGKIFQTIKRQIRERIGENTKVSFAIFGTEYKENFIYCEAYTHFVQEEKL